jgi:hypothetical protein
MTVGVSVCYPSAAPATNRDPTQHWVWGNDALVRPYSDMNLCLSTPLVDSMEYFCSFKLHYINYFFLPDYANVYLKPCNYDDVDQHWAWQGGEIPAIGKESGSIGWGPYSVGIVEASSL